MPMWLGHRLIAILVSLCSSRICLIVFLNTSDCSWALWAMCQSTTLHIKLCAFLMHCVLDSACYTTLHCPLHVPPPLICLFVCLPLSLAHMSLVCLFVSPSALFLLIDGQWTSAKSNCTCSIRRGLGRRLRSSLLLNSSPRCNLPCRIVY